MHAGLELQSTPVTRETSSDATGSSPVARSSDKHVADQLHELDQSVREMEEELRVLELKEKSARLKTELHQRKTSVQNLESVLLQPTASQGNALGYGVEHSSMRLDLDPQRYLGGKANVKYRRICDFIPSLASDDVEEFDMGPFVMKMNGSSKTKRDAVSPAQWISANARILGEVAKESMCMSTVLDYLSYTSKIGEYATRFTWASTLVYDDEYRKTQAQYGFRWGSDTPHVAQIFLREKDGLKKQSKKSSGKRSDGKPYCYDYNNGKICQRKDCVYRHQCEVCDGEHPKSSHADNRVVSQSE